MRITPLDVRKQEFRRAVRGFDCDEVRAFMTTLADEYEIVLVDNKQIREKLMAQDEKISEYQTMERTLRDTLMTAEKVMQETRENANREGDLIVQEAKLKAKEILSECRLRTEELRKEIESLRKEKEAYLGRFKSLAESQIHFIESHRNDFRDLDQRLLTIVDSVAEGVADRADEAAKEAVVVDTIVEAMIQPEPAGTPIVDQTPAPAPTHQEEDIWRNYTPVSKPHHQAAPEIQANPAIEANDAPGTPREETHSANGNESIQDGEHHEHHEHQENHDNEAWKREHQDQHPDQHQDQHQDQHHEEPIHN